MDRDKRGKRETMSAAKLSTYQKVRAGVWATGIGIIVMAGTWFGAGLKEQRQFEEVRPSPRCQQTPAPPPKIFLLFLPAPYLPLLSAFQLSFPAPH